MRAPLLFSVLFCTLCYFQAASAVLDPFDQSILATFQQRSGPSNLNWNPLISFCGQTGVTCVQSGATERVSALSLVGLSLRGTIPSSLFTLPELTFIDLSNNLLMGSIPTEIGLRNLTQINFSNNYLYGKIPTEMGMVSDLLILNLGTNTITSTIPTELGSLTSLFALDMRNNQLYGTIPNEIFQISTLNLLILSNNFLQGTIPVPPFFSTLSTLALDHNQLSSTIPSVLGQIFLVTLRLNDNQLYGRLPADLTSSFFLTRLSIQNNRLSGPLPTFFFPMNELYAFGTNSFCPIYDLSLVASSYDAPSPDAPSPCQMCSSNNCLSGTCVDLGTDFTCDCSATPFSGDYCEQGTPVCTIVCKNGGTCARGNTCDCGTFLTSGRGYRFQGPVCTNATRCYAESSNQGIWATSFPPDYRLGSCPPGYVGKPFRQCRLDGTWGPIFDPCLSSPACPGVTEKNIVWPSTPAGSTAVGSCIAGYHGTPTRNCMFNGVWDGIYQPCQVNKCAQINDGVTLWRETVAASATYGVCLVGTGRPYRSCDMNGVFGPVMGTPCS